MTFNLTQQRVENLKKALRCKARRKSDHKQCQAPAIKGRTVCRMHGGKGGAPIGNKNRLVHGMRSKEVIETSRKRREKRKDLYMITKAIDDGRFIIKENGDIVTKEGKKLYFDTVGEYL